MDQQQDDNEKLSTDSFNVKEETMQEMDQDSKVAARRTRVPILAASTAVFYEPQPTTTSSNRTRMPSTGSHATSAASMEGNRKIVAQKESSLSIASTQQQDASNDGSSNSTPEGTQAASQANTDNNKRKSSEIDKALKKPGLKQERGRSTSIHGNDLIPVASLQQTSSKKLLDRGLVAGKESSTRSSGSRSISPIPQPRIKKGSSNHGLNSRNLSKSPPPSSSRSSSPVPPGALQKARSYHGLSRDNSKRHGLCRDNSTSPLVPQPPPQAPTERHSANASLIASRVPSDITLTPLQSRRAAYEAKFRSNGSSIGSDLNGSQSTMAAAGSNHNSEQIGNEAGSCKPLRDSNEFLVDMVNPETDLKQVSPQRSDNNNNNNNNINANSAMEISPGAYAEDGDGTHLVRNRDLRFSLVGVGASDVEVGLAEALTGTTRAETNILPSAIVQADGTERTDSDDPSIEVSESQPVTPCNGLVEATPVLDPSIALVDVEHVGSTELQKIAVKEEVNHRRAFRKAASLTICGLLALVAVLLIVSFQVIQDQNANDATTTVAPEGPPTPAPTPFFFDVPDYTAEAIKQSAATAQAQAYRWLINDPNREDYSEWRLNQRFALATLYFATTTLDTAMEGTIGHSWRNEKSWLLHSEHECTWYADSSIELGFSTLRMKSPCDEDDKYEHLWLQNNNLHGSLPPEVALLTSLKSIAMSGNYLEGTVPSHIWGLPSLKHMLLSYNANITGSIPSEIGLTNLEYCSVQWTSLTGVLPSQIGLLTDLSALVLDNNDITGAIPSELGFLPKIEYLVLNANRLTATIPTELGLISSLRYLVLSINNLTGPLPVELAMASKLFYLAVSDNLLTGTLPKDLFHLTALQEISFSQNALSGVIPSELGLMKKNSFFVDGNYLSGSLPSEVGQLHELNDLIVNDNDLTGSLFTELGLLTSLNTLSLNENRFNGTIPSQIGRLNELVFLITSGNDKITGSLPSQIGLLTDMVYLNVSHCSMTGTLPSEVGKLTGLRLMYLQGNRFSAPLPAEISLLGNLTDFQWSARRV